MESLPTVSIVIPAWNEERRIRACVLAALDQSVAAIEIIVVDNKSTDGTARVVRALHAEHPDAPIRYLTQNAIQGLIATRNLGFDAAIGDVVGRIDADSVLQPDWVAVVQKAFVDQSVSATTGPVIYYDMPMQKFGLKADDAMRRAMIRLAHQYNFVFGSNMALRKSAWDTIRNEVCLDEDDELHEDIDVSVHLHQHGLKVKYVTAMVAGISARRLDDSPRDYLYYMTRFERTYDRHGVKGPGVRAPMWLLLFLYPGLKIVRRNMVRRAAALNVEL
jgi:glycosyltransferase involved in cell wall biosynthesis